MTILMIISARKIRYRKSIPKRVSCKNALRAVRQLQTAGYGMYKANNGQDVELTAPCLFLRYGK